jgi:hypothetical protein
MDISIFDQISSALTVRSLCSGLGPDIPAGSNFEEVENLTAEVDILNFLNYPSRIVEPNGDVKGILWCGNLDAVEAEGWNVVDEFAEQLEPNELLSSSTTVLDAVELFGTKENRYFYVIHGNEIVGVLFYRDLFKPLGRLAFLALALEIEDMALKLCQSPSINERCWHSIPDNRKYKAIELFKVRYNREPFSERKASELSLLRWETSDVGLLIECTNLVDKATMIWNQRLVASATRKSVLGFFNDLKEVRDRCAHPGGRDELLPKDRLAHFVQSAKRMRDSLREAIRNLGVEADTQD